MTMMGTKIAARRTTLSLQKLIFTNVIENYCNLSIIISKKIQKIVKEHAIKGEYSRYR